jgi:HEAT repeat protein
MILRCPKCESPVDVPDDPGALVTCQYCDLVSRRGGDRLFALRQWDAAIEPEKPPPPPPAPEKPAGDGADLAGMKLDKRAWKAPEQPVAAPLFPPSDPTAAARSMSQKPGAAEPEEPQVPLATRLRPALRIGAPAVAGAGLLVVGIVACVRIFGSDEEGKVPKDGAPPPVVAPDPEAARRAKLAEEVAAARKKLEAGGVFAAADVPALVELLQVAALRVRAAEALGKIGAPAAAAVPALLALLEDPAAGPAALEAAFRIAPASDPLRHAVEFLLESELKNVEALPVRLAAITAYEEMGVDGARRIGAGLHAPAPEVREACVAALLRIGAPALPVALSTLRPGGNPATQAAATAVIEGIRDVPGTDAEALIAGIGKHPPADRAIFAHLRALGAEVLPSMLRAFDAREERRGEDWWDGAQECMESFGAAAAAVLGKWLKENRVERPRLRERLARAAGGWGPAAVPFLAATLSDVEASVRGAAVESLGRIGPGAVEAWEALQTAAAQGGLDHRLAATAVRMKGAEAVPLLVQMVKSAFEASRVAAVKELGALGGAAAAAVPDLISFLPDAKLRPALLAALEQIGDPVVEPLVRELGHESPEVRAAAAATLGKLGPRTAAVTPALARVLADENKDAREAALRALLLMGSEGVLEFEKALKNKDRGVRALAIWALGEFGPAAARALPELRALLKREPDAVRKAIVRTIARMGPRGASELAELLKDAHAGTREWSAQALGDMGEDAVAAIPALKAAMGDEEGAVKAAAAAAVKKLEGR